METPGYHKPLVIKCPKQTPVGLVGSPAEQRHELGNPTPPRTPGVDIQADVSQIQMLWLDRLVTMLVNWRLVSHMMGTWAHPVTESTAPAVAHHSSIP